MPDLNFGVIGNSSVAALIETEELWGNYPQTYSLVGLIVCAMRLSKSWEEAFWRGW
jgi:hypothetical protein